MKTVITEELNRIKEIMGISKQTISEGIGQLLRGVSNAFADVDSLLLKLGDEISTQIENGLGKKADSIDEIADLMDREAGLAGRIISKLSETDRAIAAAISDSFTALPEFQNDWISISKSLMSGYDDVATAAETTLKTTYGFSDNVIDLLKTKASAIYRKGHDLSNVQTLVAKQNVINKLKTLKNYEDVTDPKFVEAIDNAVGVLSDSEIQSIITKRAPNWLELMDAQKQVGKLNKLNKLGSYTLESWLESNGYRLGPEAKRYLTKIGYNSATWLKGGDTWTDISKNWVFRLLFAGALTAGYAQWIYSAPEKIKTTTENLYDTAGNLTKTEGEMKAIMQSQLKSDNRFKGKEISNVKILSRVSPMDIMVYFSDGSENKFKHNLDADRFDLVGDISAPSDPLSGFKEFIKNTWGADYTGKETFRQEGNNYIVTDDSGEDYKYITDGSSFKFVE